MVVAISITLRIGYIILSVPPSSPTGGHVDIWGDGVHFWLLSYLTAKNNFFYSDLRPNGLQLIWLPLHPMITAFVMRVTGIYSLDVIRTLDVLYGSFTALVVYCTVKPLFNRGTHAAFAAGLGLAFNAWWIATNSEGVVESLLALILSLLVYYWIKGNRVATSFLILIAGFVKYEAWAITLMLLFADLVIHRLRTAVLVNIAAWVTPILVWCGWSYRLTGNPLSWYFNQATALAWDISIIGKPSSLVASFYYPRELLVMTGGLFALACLSAIKRSSRIRTLVAVALALSHHKVCGLRSRFTPSLGEVHCDSDPVDISISRLAAPSYPRHSEKESRLCCRSAHHRSCLLRDADHSLSKHELHIQSRDESWNLAS